MARERPVLHLGARLARCRKNGGSMMLSALKKSWGRASAPAGAPTAGNTASASELAIHRREHGSDGAVEEPGDQFAGVGKVIQPLGAAEVPAPELPIILLERIGPDNQSIMTCANRARRVAVMLARRGYIIKRIDISLSIGTVTLKSTRGCRDLGGVQTCRALCDGADARTYSVLIDGVTVEWTVRTAWQQGDAI